MLAYLNNLKLVCGLTTKPGKIVAFVKSTSSDCLAVTNSS